MRLVVRRTASAPRNNRYGYFSDEFYYLACSDHLAWGYVDHPPLSVAFLALIRAMLGGHHEQDHGTDRS